MKVLLFTALILVLTGCATVRNLAESDLKSYCRQTDDIIDAHVDALIEDGGDKSVLTGDLYVTVRDKACDA